MAKKLIPDNEFQTVISSSEGVLTVRSTSTSSPGNQNLLRDYGLINVVPPVNEFGHQNIISDNDLLPHLTPIEQIPVLLYTQGTCFENLNSDALITTKEELYTYLCDVLIRFDTSPKYYQKEDYKALIQTLVGSLIYLYEVDAANQNDLSAAPFLGIAVPNTNPFTYALTHKHKYPGVYFAETEGYYNHFNITVTKADLKGSIVLLIPTIENKTFISYRKDLYTIDTVGDKYYQHTQGRSASTWYINHNLDKYPSVFVRDSAGTVVEGEITYIDRNNVRIDFSGSFGGFAELN